MSFRRWMAGLDFTQEVGEGDLNSPFPGKQNKSSGMFQNG